MHRALHIGYQWGYTEHRDMKMGMPDLPIKVVEVIEMNLGMSDFFVTKSTFLNFIILK